MAEEAKNETAAKAEEERRYSLTRVMGETVRRKHRLLVKEVAEAEARIIERLERDHFEAVAWTVLVSVEAVKGSKDVPAEAREEIAVDPLPHDPDHGQG